MGCNNSRLNASGEVVPPKIRPLLLRRIEELRKHRNAATIGGEGTLSKKQLLKDAAAEEDNCQSYHEDENGDKISPKEPQPAKEQTVVRVVTVEKLSKVVPLPASEYGTEEQHNKHEDHSQEKVKDVENKAEVELITERVKSAWPQPENKHEEANAEHDDDDEEEEEEQEKEEDDNEIDRLLGPGSPSFRIYIETEKRKKEECENQIIVVHQKSPSAESFESSASGNSGNSNEAVEIGSTTKRRKRKMNKLGAMKKNILNVKNLQMKHRMNPMFSCAGNDRKSLLSPK